MRILFAITALIFGVAYLYNPLTSAEKIMLGVAELTMVAIYIWLAIVTEREQE